MLVVISPAKTLDFEGPLLFNSHSLPVFAEDAAALAGIMAGKSLTDIASMMSVSDRIAALNVARFQSFARHVEAPQDGKARQALFAFQGDVYVGFAARSLSKKALAYTQTHLRILSGLYGVLAPLDLIQPYRLEMGTRLETRAGSSLYAWWGTRIGEALERQAAAIKAGYLLNLASNEYFKAVARDALSRPVISPDFRDEKAGQYKVISFYAKRARGMMARWVMDERIQRPEDLAAFAEAGYRYSATHSSENKPVFIRDARDIPAS